MVWKSRIDHKLESEQCERRCVADVDQELAALEIRREELQQERVRLTNGDTNVRGNEVAEEFRNDRALSANTRSTSNPLHEAAI